MFPLDSDKKYPFKVKLLHFEYENKHNGYTEYV